MISAAARGVVRALARFEDLLITVLTGGLVLLAGGQIVARLAFDQGWSMLEPALRAMVLWIALLGAMIASREDKHLAIDALSRVVRGLGARVLRACAYLGAAVITGLLTWYSLLLVHGEYESGTVAFGSIPAWTVQAIMPFAFAAMTLRFVIHAFLPPKPLDH